MNWMNETDTSLRYRHWRMCFERTSFRHSLDDKPGILFDIAAQPILEYRWIVSYSHQLEPMLRTAPAQDHVLIGASLRTVPTGACSGLYRLEPAQDHVPTGACTGLYRLEPAQDCTDWSLLRIVPTGACSGPCTDWSLLQDCTDWSLHRTVPTGDCTGLYRLETCLGLYRQEPAKDCTDWSLLRTVPTGACSGL